VGVGRAVTVTSAVAVAGRGILGACTVPAEAGQDAVPDSFDSLDEGQVWMGWRRKADAGQQSTAEV